MDKYYILLSLIFVSLFLNSMEELTKTFYYREASETGLCVDLDFSNSQLKPPTYFILHINKDIENDGNTINQVEKYALFEVEKCESNLIFSAKNVTNGSKIFVSMRLNTNPSNYFSALLKFEFVIWDIKSRNDTFKFVSSMGNVYLSARYEFSGEAYPQPAVIDRSQFPFFDSFGIINFHMCWVSIFRDRYLTIYFKKIPSDASRLLLSGVMVSIFINGLQTETYVTYPCIEDDNPLIAQSKFVYPNPQKGDKMLWVIYDVYNRKYELKFDMGVDLRWSLEPNARVSSWDDFDPVMDKKNLSTKIFNVYVGPYIHRRLACSQYDIILDERENIPGGNRYILPPRRFKYLTKQGSYISQLQPMKREEAIKMMENPRKCSVVKQK